LSPRAQLGALALSAVNPMQAATTVTAHMSRNRAFLRFAPTFSPDEPLDVPLPVDVRLSATRPSLG
jgi:hypothetical protein